MTAQPNCTVYFDGGCPLCRREIAFYRRRSGAESIEWVDVSQAGPGELGRGLNAAKATARFHVRDSKGALHSGGAGFAALWRALPNWRALGLVAGLPPVRWTLERCYRGFLRVRPWLQRRLATTEADEGLLPDWLLADLRSDHAGETGAVAIYSGILRVSRDPGIRRFASAHRATESDHLRRIEAVLPLRHRSVLLPVWRVAGFVTGSLPALFGASAVYRTIDAVETFVDRHYQQQITRLNVDGAHPEIAALLERCRLDEVGHRDEARAEARAETSFAARIWGTAIEYGSAFAVWLARKF